MGAKVSRRERAGQAGKKLSVSQSLSVISRQSGPIASPRRLAWLTTRSAGSPTKIRRALRGGCRITPERHNLRPVFLPELSLPEAEKRRPTGSERPKRAFAVSWNAPLKRVTSPQRRVTRITQVRVAPRPSEGFLGHPGARSKLEIRNWQLEIRNPKFETGNSKLGSRISIFEFRLSSIPFDETSIRRLNCDALS
jgi:hypothetical protein